LHSSHESSAAAAHVPPAGWPPAHRRTDRAWRRAMVPYFLTPAAAETMRHLTPAQPELHVSIDGFPRAVVPMPPLAARFVALVAEEVHSVDEVVAAVHRQLLHEQPTEAVTVHAAGGASAAGAPAAASSLEDVAAQFFEWFEQAEGLLYVAASRQGSMRCYLTCPQQDAGWALLCFGVARVLLKHRQKLHNPVSRLSRELRALSAEGRCGPVPRGGGSRWASPSWCATAHQHSSHCE
jgi:hypothetical protein